MKKFLALILIVFTFDVLAYKNRPLFLGCDGVYTITIGEGSKGVFKSFFTDDIDEFYLYSRIDGQSVTTENEEFIREFLEKYECEKVFSETVSGIVVNYYYTPQIFAYRSINGLKVNVQTAKSGDNYTIGSPLIYGGY